jgi:hypothetical protein
MAMKNQPTGSRGRTAQTTKGGVRGTKSAIQVEKRTESTKPIGRGGGKNRGDRRDTNAQFTGSRTRTPNMGDPLGSGRKQVQGGGKAKRGGGKKQKGTYDRA